MSVQELLEENREMLIVEYKKGVSTCELGRQIGCSNASVYVFLRDKCGITMNKKTSIEDYKDELKRLHAEGKSAYAISKELNLSSSTVWRYLTKLNLSVADKSRNREDPLVNHTEEIINLYEEGEGCHRLAKRFHCEESSILRLLAKNGIEKRRFQVLPRETKYKGCEKINSTYWRGVIHSAEKRNIEMDISIQDAWDQFIRQDGKCSLTGISLTFVTSQWSRNSTSQTASLDRIDSSQGYIASNIQWVHKKVNMLKTAFNEKEFIKWCTLVADYQRGNSSPT